MPDLPWDFVVLGVPASAQSKRSKPRWKLAVAAAAAARWPAGSPLMDQPVMITITYFHNGTTLDSDNIIKPIQDALNGVVYEDDKLCTRATVDKKDINAEYRLLGLTEALAEGFVSGKPFVHIKIEDLPDRRDLP